MALKAPRILNAPIGCSLSSLRCAPSSSTYRSRVRRAMPLLRSAAAASWMSGAVTTLLLGLGAWGFGLGLGLRRRRRRRFVVISLGDVLVLVFLYDARHIHHQ